jgi:hypothetical protein
VFFVFSRLCKCLSIILLFSKERTKISLGFCFNHYTVLQMLSMKNTPPPPPPLPPAFSCFLPGLDYKSWPVCMAGAMSSLRQRLLTDHAKQEPAKTTSFRFIASHLNFFSRLEIQTLQNIRKHKLFFKNSIVICIVKNVQYCAWHVIRSC